MRVISAIEEFESSRYTSKEAALLQFSSKFTVLKNLSTDSQLLQQYGPNHQSIVTNQFRHSLTAESYMRTIFVFSESILAGYATFFPANEYVERKRNSAGVIAEASNVPRLRLKLANTKRVLTKTQLGPWSPDQLFIESIAVLPQFRRREYATTLLSHVVKEASAQAFVSIGLNTRKQNNVARALYESSGFTIYSESMGSLRMEKTLYV